MISPVLLKIGNLEIRYYGLIYAVMFYVGLKIVLYLKDYRKNVLKLPEYRKFNDDIIYDFFLYLIIGSILTARLFYIIFYNLNFYLANPYEIFKFWHGGMSIHGGFVGGILAAILFSNKYKINFYDIADIAIVPVGLGLAVGRIGNFINQELYGRITNVPWAVKFNGVPGKRHPSQIYEFFKNLIIFVTLFKFNKKKQPKGFLFWTFVLMYGVLRFLVEFFREPEIVFKLPLSFFSEITMGQVLSLPMILLGGFMVWKIKSKQKDILKQGRNKHSTKKYNKSMMKNLKNKNKQI